MDNALFALFGWLVEHWDTISAVLLAVIGIFLRTKRGLEYKDALLLLARTIERQNAAAIKQDVNAESSKNERVRTVIETAVAVVDEKKETPREPVVERFTRALLKGDSNE